MTEHTPGPWRVGDFGIYAAHHFCVCVFEARRSSQTKANAALIAAAPAMLDRLTEVEKILQFAFEDGALPHETVVQLCVDPYGVLADIRAVIAEAKCTALTSAERDTPQ